MNISDLKLELILQISNLNDKMKLEEILELLKFQTESSIHEVSEEEKIAIIEAKNQILNNNVLSNNVVNEEMKIIARGNSKTPVPCPEDVFCDAIKATVDLALENASCAFPLRFSLVDRSGKSYEAISLSDDRFDECLYVDYDSYGSVNADFNRFGVYFINGLGLFKINIIGQKGCVLKYVAGANKKDGFNYNYTTTSIVPHRNIAVQELATLAFGNELKPEESF